MTYQQGLSLLFIAVGLVFGFYWLYCSYKSLISKFFWTHTLGKVLQYEIEEENDSEWGFRYHVKVNYEYIVLGVCYQGSRVQFTDEGGYELEYLKKNGLFDLSPGNEIDLYYSTKQPTNSVLLNKIAPGSLLVMTVCFLVAIGAFQYTHDYWGNL